MGHDTADFRPSFTAFRAFFGDPGYKFRFPQGTEMFRPFGSITGMTFDKNCFDNTMTGARIGPQVF